MIVIFVRCPIARLIAKITYAMTGFASLLIFIASHEPLSTMIRLLSET
jgi:hypothetical protein